MATTLTLTPNLSGGVAQALNDRNPFYIAQDGLDMPVVSYDEEYAESIYMEGGRRTRSREQNPEGKVTLHLTGGLSGSQVRTYLDQLEQTVQACRVYGGVIALALEGTTTVYYDIESISLSTLGVADFQFERVSVELSVTTRPYGRLAPVSLVSNATSSDPIQSVSLANIPGSAPALVQATVTDTATQARDHLEIGLDADYDPSTRTNLVTNPSFETNTTGWSTSVPAYHLNSGAVLSRVTPTVAQSGSYVGQIVTPGAANAEGVAYAFSGYTFLAGTAYTLSMRVMADAATDVDLILGKASADAAWSDLSLAAGTWTDISVTWTPAADGSTVYAVLHTDLGGSPVARTIQIDKVMVEAASSAGTYFDGRVGGIWTGTADASTSMLGTFPLYDSAWLDTTGLAGSATTRTGAYSSNGVIRTTLASTQVGICEKTGLPHKGRHRVKARVYGTDTGPMYARVAYRVASGSWTRNGWVRVTALDGFYELDLGLVTGPAAGTLSVRVEAYSEAGGDTLDVDYLLLIPAYRYAKAKGETTPGATFATWDTFDQSAGNLDAPKAANIGGNWAEANRTGADGFQVETTGHTAQRTTVSDASLDGGGCYAYLGSAVAACTVQATVKFYQTVNEGSRFGLLARYSDTNNWVALVLVSVGLEVPSLSLYKKKSGTVSRVAWWNSGLFDTKNYTHLLRLDLGVDGFYRTYWGGTLLSSGSDPDLATGGALASGKCGLYDAYTSSSANTRNYDDFQTTTPSATHVIDASGAVVLGDDSIARSDGTRPPSFEGSYLTVPPAGREDRTHRLAVKMRRSDVDIAPDANIGDSQRVDVTVTPRVVLL